MTVRFAGQVPQVRGFLLCLLMDYQQSRPFPCFVSGRCLVKLGRERCLAPDLFVLPESARSPALRAGHALPPALLVIEMIDPSAREVDLKNKARLYREAAVDEVWSVDQPGQVVLVDRLAADGKGYARRAVRDGTIVAGSLDGFWIDVGWLWRDPEPDFLDCMATILSGPPRAL